MISPFWNAYQIFLRGLPSERMFNFKSLVPSRSKTRDVESTLPRSFQPSSSPALSVRDESESEDGKEEIELLTTEVKITHAVPPED